MSVQSRISGRYQIQFRGQAFVHDPDDTVITIMLHIHVSHVRCIFLLFFTILVRLTRLVTLDIVSRLGYSLESPEFWRLEVQTGAGDKCSFRYFTVLTNNQDIF